MDSLQGITQWILHLFCTKEYYHVRDYEHYFKKGFVSSVEFFSRFENKVDFKGKSVLDVGCGLGATCFYMALNARKELLE
jgi:2-polyprenyl-3-methyl-5-hydroxy-6-metoxy-1,4-benzoquinol methylase